MTDPSAAPLRPPGQRLAGAVADRGPGESVVAAVRRAFLEAVGRDEPTLGIDAGMVAFWRVVDDSPALQARGRLLGELAESALAERLAGTADCAADPTMTRVAAAVIAGVDRALHADIRRRMTLGEDRDTVRTAISSAADRAFAAVSVGVDACLARTDKAMDSRP